jgi:Tfp pilus assembly protein PilP
MKLMIGILAMGMAVGTAWGQNPDIVQDTRDTMKALHQKQQIESDAALGISAKKPVQAAPVQHVDQAELTSRSASAKQKAAPASKSSLKASGTATRRAGKPTLTAQKIEKPATAPADKSKAIVITGQRDPFLSPVVNQSMSGSGCSVGKRCLAIDQIALKGIVKSDNGMIAVVVNALDKAYFLRENDPVFNGYVVKITGDSIVFKENVQDHLGKPFTRQVTKKINTPAV